MKWLTCPIIHADQKYKVQATAINIYIYIYIYINLKSVTCLLCHKVLGMITKHNKSALFYVQRLLFSRYPNASSLDA